MTVRSLEPFQYALHAHVRSGSVSRRGHNQWEQITDTMGKSREAEIKLHGRALQRLEL